MIYLYNILCLIILRKDVVPPIGDATKLFVSQQNVKSDSGSVNLVFILEILFFKTLMIIGAIL